MLEYLYEWIRQIAYYMILVTAVMQVAAGQSYRKYIRLFTSVILVLMILAPVIRIFGIREMDTAVWAEEEYETAAEQMEEKIQELEREAGISGWSANGEEQEAEDTRNGETGQIEVEEIKIGR